MTAPTIETSRLILRGFKVEDLADHAAVWGDPEVARFTGGKPSTREETWARLLRSVGHWQVMGFGFWAIQEKDTGRFVGETGAAEFRREIDPSYEGAPEAGWVLAPWAHGKGYAHEAANAALSWLDANRMPERTVCIIDPDNAASIRLAGRLGFAGAGQATYRGQPVAMFNRVSRPG